MATATRTVVTDVLELLQFVTEFEFFGPCWTPLHLVCVNGDAVVIKYRVQKNCQLNLVDSFKRLSLVKTSGGDNKSFFQKLELTGMLKISMKGEGVCQNDTELLVENMDGENIEEPHAGSAEDSVVLSSSFPVRTVDKAALAQDAGGAQPVGEVEQEHDAEFPEDFKACTQLQQEPANALKKQAISEAILELTTYYNSVLDEDSLCLQKELDTGKAEMPKQNVLSLTSEGLHSMSEEALQPRAHAKEHVDQSDREKTELLEQHNSEAQQVFKLAEEICRHTVCLCRELIINFEAEKDCKRMKAQLHGAVSKRRAYEEREMESKISSEDITKNNCSETGSESAALRRKHCSQTKTENATLHQLPRSRKKPATAEPRTEAFMVRDLSQKLEKESKKCMQLQAQNCDLQEQLSTMRENLEKLEKSKCQLEEEVAKLKHHLETNMVDRSQTEQYKREAEEAAQGKRHEMQKASELYNLLEKESKKCTQLESQNRNLREQLSAIRENHENLEKSERQLKGVVANLKHHMYTNMVDRSQIRQYKREVDERATQELRQKLEEVNLFLQTQAVSQHRLQQVRGSLYEMRYRLRDLQWQMKTMQSSYQESHFQQKFLCAELERYKKRYLEEVYSKKRLENELERTRKQLSEAYAKISQELRRKITIHKQQ
ncbi:ankyrin repeat domain-containing protein 26-like [Lathamus discolor]|uniref:ankyrin repeat domain-containing protein 26-like n=1 Tax=Lathamus discolor TaxID=678569 RepID=UPI0032B73C59